MKALVLNKQISILKNHNDKEPMTVNLTDYLSDTSCRDLILEIRSLVDESDQKQLKALLPCAMISGKFSSRTELLRHSGLLPFDIDLKGNEHVINHPALFKSICDLPYVAYLGRSCRGSGYWGIIPISNPKNHKLHFAAMAKVFLSIGITIDPAPSAVNSLRYQSFDDEAYFNHNADTFSYIYTEPEEPKKAYQLSPNTIAGTNPFDDFNNYGCIENLLESHGWTFQHTKGSRKRYSRPGKNRGISADYCTLRRVFYLFSNDPATSLETPRKGYNPVQVFCQLECGSDWKLCAQKLKALGFGTGQTNAIAQINHTALLQANPNY